MLSVVIPCYNEQDNLHVLLQSLDRLAASGTPIEIILVDNGSTDNSAAVFEEELKTRNREIFKVHTVQKNIGYGFGILSGLRAASGEILAVTHADRQTDPMDVLRALEIYNQYNNKTYLIKGRRVKRKITEYLFSTGMGWLATFVLGTKLMDINAQPKLFSKEFFDGVEKDAPNDFALDLYLLYKAKKQGKIYDFPVVFAKRVAGEAKGGSGSSWKVRKKLILRCYNYIFELRKHVKSTAK